MNADNIDHIRSVLNAAYPGWTGPSDPRFVGDEIDYKRAAIEKATTRLSDSALTDLIERGRFTEVVERLEEVGKETNLLYLATPRSGDLNILYDPNLDAETFARAIRDLLHGEGTPPARLDRYAHWVDNQGLPNRWTFPTYFLFLTHPENNLLVKPQATGRFLEMAGADFKLGSRPSGEVYGRVLQLADRVKQALMDGEVEDMVPVQSVIWVAGRRGYDMGVQKLDDDRQATLERLLDEFERSYVSTDDGAAHLAAYPEIRETGRANFEQVLSAHEAGQDVTDLVLTKLLPHRDTPANRARGAWTHVTPTVPGEVRTLMESAGYVAAEDWPAVSRTILDFLTKVVEDPDTLDKACKRFAESEYSRGFQTGMLTPMLHALVPDQLLLMSNKARAVVNHFLGLSHSQQIGDYPELNTAGHYLLNRIREPLVAILPEGVTEAEGFDAFGHWLVTIKGYRFGRTQAWKVAVEDPSTWQLWVDGGYAGLHEASLEDVSATRKKDWEDLRARTVATHPETTGERLDEVWSLATDAQEGDLVVAVQGTDRVVGIGMLVGPYEYHPEGAPEHRVPVEWQDTDPRAISEPGWRKRFHDVEPKQLDRIRELPAADDEAQDALFTRQTFQLLDGIRATPTRDYYNEHQDDFRAHVEEPLKELLTGVAALLPPSMKEVLETEKYLFSRFPKNDWGLGGAWDFYWGAFYPRGGRRVASAQLFVWIGPERLEYGFTLGHYAEDQFNRFLSNVRRRGDSIIAALTPHIDTDDLVFGAVREGSEIVEQGQRGLSIQEWLSDIEASEVSARVMVPRDELLSLAEADLRANMLQTFLQLFPLILLATSEEPLGAIADYLGEGGGDDVELQPEYPLEECAADTGFDVPTLRRWVEATNRKGQAIFYGPPGTGKTFMAEHVAKHMVGGGDGLVELVQFHPAYAYEDFIQGIRPITRPDGDLEYQMVPGRFLEFCRRAQNRSGVCVLIIDEINRANLSRVFGELMYLLEYRDRDIPLSSGGTFRIPKNVRLLGTMNTADRSIALVDHALRRRFAFVPLRPRFEILRAFHEDTGKSVDALIEKLTQINKAISDPNYHVGITFFMDPKLEENLEMIWRMEIEPYLEEFFFDEAATVDRFRWDRIGEELGV